MCTIGVLRLFHPQHVCHSIVCVTRLFSIIFRLWPVDSQVVTRYTVWHTSTCLASVWVSFYRCVRVAGAYLNIWTFNVQLFAIWVEGCVVNQFALQLWVGSNPKLARLFDVQAGRLWDYPLLRVVLIPGR